MGEYANDDQALIGLARQLADAYGEARTREDQDYACEAVADFLAEYGESAPSAALIALLDLQYTAETFPLVDRAKTILLDRGLAVVEQLLEAALGRVYDTHGPTSENALDVLGSVDDDDLVQGLLEVLGGDGDDELKAAAVDGLIALGDVAAEDLRTRQTLDDPVAGPWVRTVLDEIGSAGGEAEDACCEIGDAVVESTPSEAASGIDASDADAPEVAAAGLEPAEADQGLVDGSYEDFLQRLEQEWGEWGEGGEDASSAPPS